MLDGIDLADIHGQFKFNFRARRHLARRSPSSFSTGPFASIFERNGPSLFRICETIFQGWKRYRDSRSRVRERMNEAMKLRTTYNAALWAMEKRLKKTNASVSVRIRELRREIEHEFGGATRCCARWWGRFCYGRRSAKTALARGKTYEPPTFVDRRNWVEA